MNISQKIEAILFWRAEPVFIKKLATLLGEKPEIVKQGLIELENDLKGRGIALVQTDDEVMLGTAKELSSLIEQLTKEELTRDLGKAGLETLSIILYQGPITRAEIDYIRGVNSQFIVRALLIRGLIQRIDNPKGERSFLYKPTIDLLTHLGIKKIEDLPEFVEVKRDIETFKQSTESKDLSSATIKS